MVTDQKIFVEENGERVSASWEEQKKIYYNLDNTTWSKYFPKYNYKTQT